MLEPVFQLIIYEYEPEGFEWQAFLIILMLPRQNFYFFAVNSPLTRSIDWLGFTLGIQNMVGVKEQNFAGKKIKEAWNINENVDIYICIYTSMRLFQQRLWIQEN